MTIGDKALGEEHLQHLDQRYKLVFEEAVRSASIAAQSVEGVRTRTGTLLSGLTISTSFLGGLAIGGEDSLGWFSWVAIIGFAVSAILCLAILWRREFAMLRFDPEALLVTPLGEPTTTSAMDLDVHAQDESTFRCDQCCQDGEIDRDAK